MSERTLTDADVAAIVEGMKGHSTCNLGLTPDQASTLKRLLNAFDGAASIVGKVVITAIVMTLIAVFTKGFWLSLATGIKSAPK